MGPEQAKNLTEVKNVIFIESIKGLFLMNGGGAISLATWIQAVWEKEWATPMLYWQLFGMLAFGFGVFCAGVAYLFRFFAFYHRKATEPKENPCWWAHVGASTFSVLCFAIGVFLVVMGGFSALGCRGG